MAKTMSLDVPDELRTLHARSVEVRDRFVYGVVQSHKRLLPREERAKLKRTAQVASPQKGRGSLLKFLSPYWHALTPEQRDVWRASAVFSGMSGWQLFASDNIARIQNNFSFPVSPLDEWQVRAGQIVIGAPATSFSIKQDHPQQYFTAQKMPGKPWKKNIYSVEETFSFPLEISIAYKSDLSTIGTGQKARFFARVKTSYQGTDIETDLNINFAPVSDWSVATASLSSLRGIFISYTLYMEFLGYRGTILFDNVRAVHSGTNWARDFRCDDVQKTFTKAFAVVPPYWVPLDMGEGVTFSSVLPFD